MIDRGAGFISSAAEPLQGRRSGVKGDLAETGAGWSRGGWGPAEYAVHCHNPVVERYL